MALLPERKDCCFTCSQGQKLLSVSVWDVRTGITCRIFSCDTGVNSLRSGSKEVGGASALCILGENHLLCAPKAVPFIYVWNLKKEQVLLKIACVGVVQSLSCSPDGVYCVAGIGEKIYAWHVCTGNMVGVVSQHFRPVSVLKFSDDGVHLCSGGQDGRTIVWRMIDIVSGAPLPGLNGLSSQVTSLATPTSLTRHVWADHTLPVTDLHCGRGGLQCRVFTCSLDQTCKIYEMCSGRLLCSILLGCGLTCLAVDLAERWLFLGGSNGSISRVNLHTKPLGPDLIEDKDQYVGHSKSVTGLAVCCWDDVLVSTSKWEDQARVWDINSHQTIREVKMKGPISQMMLQSGLLHALSKDPPSSPAPVVKVFKKHMQRSSPEDNDKTSPSFPTQLCGIDPSSNMVGLAELQSMFCPPEFFPPTSSSSEDFLLHSLKQEVAELKDVNKKLYSFCMDKLVT